jgi:hypothetical protein
MLLGAMMRCTALRNGLLRGTRCLFRRFFQCLQCVLARRDGLEARWLEGRDGLLDALGSGLWSGRRARRCWYAAAGVS